MNKFFAAILVVLVAFKSLGQVADTSFYPTGKIKQIKISQGEKIIQATAFKENSEVKFQWDIAKKTLVSFDAISYEDTLVEYFKTNCPDYTLRQHYGNGPLMVIETYKNGKRDGPYETFTESGKPIAKGQFKEWEKVGTWSYYNSVGEYDRQIHWFHHGFYEDGISIDYTIIPVIVTLLFIVLAVFFSVKYLSFSYFYISYGLFTIGIFVLLFLIGNLTSEQTLAAIRRGIGNYTFPVLTTLVVMKLVLSISVLVLKRRARVKSLFVILFMVSSLILSYMLMTAFIGSKLSGVMLG